MTTFTFRRRSNGQTYHHYVDLAAYRGFTANQAAHDVIMSAMEQLRTNVSTDLVLTTIGNYGTTN